MSPCPVTRRTITADPHMSGSMATAFGSPAWRINLILQRRIDAVSLRRDVRFPWSAQRLDEMD
jgi:hypothetical protein